jgi:hypothetical protein
VKRTERSKQLKKRKAIHLIKLLFLFSLLFLTFSSIEWYESAPQPVEVELTLRQSRIHKVITASAKEAQKPVGHEKGNPQLLQPKVREKQTAPPVKQPIEAPKETAPSTPPPTSTTPPQAVQEPSGPVYATEHIYVAGQAIAFVDGGMSMGQADIDAHPSDLASTWGGVSPFSGTDGMNTHFIGHHWGAFDPFTTLPLGATVIVTDTQATPFKYVIQKISVVDGYATDTTTGEYIYAEITSKGGGERVVFQTCIDHTTRRILFGTIAQ